MTAFERYLIDKGYLKFIFNYNEMKYEPTEKHTLSTMVNLDHRYIHKDNKPLLDMIEKGIRVTDERFTDDIRKGVIVFGLNHAGHPPTLISPQPFVFMNRVNTNGQEEWITQDFDEVMSCALDIIPFDDIFEAMYDKTIRFEIDAKKQGKPTYRKVIYSKANQ